MLATYKMASRAACGSACEIIEIKSYVRGYHKYPDDWMHLDGEMLQLKQEPNNSEGKNARAYVKKDNDVQYRGCE